MMTNHLEIKDIDQIVETAGSSTGAVIPILQAIQKKYNYLPEAALRRVCEITDITPELITGVASFYAQFRFKPAGEHIIKVCVGTACHVKGAVQVYDAFRRDLNLRDGDDTTESLKYTIEKVNCLGCCTLAPVVQIDNITYGHVTTSHIPGIIKDFEKQKDTRGKHVFKDNEGNEIKGEIRIGLGSCCVASGSEEIRNVIEKQIAQNNLHVKLKHVGCIGMCHQVPLVEIVPTGKEPILYSKVKPKDVKAIIDKHFKPERSFKRLKNQLFHAVENIQTDHNWEGIERYSLDISEHHVSSFLGRQIPVATEYRGMINPLDIEEYKSRGGFEAAKRALTEMQPDEVVEEIRKSGLRGRGGAGFPTGVKWKLVAEQKNNPKYIICNGDEGDPGAFMDRMLLESYPYRVIEGMIIAAYAT
ncbi:MAG: NAD(P)H-dependent oxidoreductase subunit E, partial [Bacteroidota bacterium]|nr:NAD(P)H-dependent oxidoreductase subunit E [Bacteroidota bacterium]